MSFLSPTHSTVVSSVNATPLMRITPEAMSILEPVVRECFGNSQLCTEVAIQYLGFTAPDYIPLELKWIEKGYYNYAEAFFQMHRHLEKLYQQLPWPKKVSKIALVTDTPGGRGDVSAVAKVIALMQHCSPSLTFDWSIIGKTELAQPFLSQLNSSRIKIRPFRYSQPVDASPADMMILGPAKCAWEIEYIDAKNSRQLAGSRVAFLENGSEPANEALPLLEAIKEMQKLPTLTNFRDVYKLVHGKVFSTKYTVGSGLTMGLRKATGVFLDESRVKAYRSRGYCCPTYVRQIKDTELRNDLLRALGVKGRALPDYDAYSLNSGYAHWSRSWGRFIDFTAVHERKKHVVIVLNQVGEFDKFDTKGFWREVFIPERLALLKQWGYASVSIKGVEKDPIIAQLGGKGGRQLTVILRSSFHPEDMRCLQLASERLLATGDNTAAEAWASKCILYLYEDVNNMGCKAIFANQQVALARTISPLLGDFLQICAKTKPLSKEEMDHAIKILQDEKFSKATLDFCNTIVENYSFKEILEGALKRTAWHQVLPKLAEVEAEAIETDVQRGIVDFIKNVQNPPKTIVLKNLDLIAQRIQQMVVEYTRLEQRSGCSIM